LSKIDELGRLITESISVDAIVVYDVNHPNSKRLELRGDYVSNISVDESGLSGICDIHAAAANVICWIQECRRGVVNGCGKAVIIANVAKKL